MEEEKKEGPTFFYNENKDPDPDVKGHFFVTQIQTLFVAIIITAIMQYSNYLAVYLIYCCPMYFFIVFIQWFAFWKPEADLTLIYNIYNGIMFLICLPVFFGVFFAVFHPTASLEFKQAQNCQLVGQLSKWIEFNEKYSILYINFEYEGKQYLGQACASNYYDAKTTEPVLPYKFYYKYDSITCGSIDKNITDPQYRRLLNYNNLNSTEVNRNERILRTGGGGGGGGGSSGGGSHSSGSHGSSSTSICLRDYKWSYVKIASWLCEDRDFDIEEYMASKSCYVNFFSSDKAYQNGQQRAFMRDSYNFPLIAYKEHAYYPQADLYTANYILKKIRRTSNQRQIAIQELEFKPNPNPNPIQIEQINKETLTVHQIQQQVNPSDNVDCMPQPQYVQQQLLPQPQLEQPQIQNLPFVEIIEMNHENEDYIVKQPVQINYSLQNPMLQC